MNRIALNGHVYTFIPSFENLTKNNGRLVPELVGVRRASTFTGFCSTHDGGIFSPLETTPFVGTTEQLFLLGYRALSRELYTKESTASMTEVRRDTDKGRGIREQVAIQAFNSTFERGVSAGLRDARAEKAEYDVLLCSRQFEEIRGYVIETTEAPPVMCSGGCFPSIDFDGKRLQDLSNLKLRPAMISFSSFWGGAAGAIVLQWRAKDQTLCERFAASLHRIPDEGVGSALGRLMFNCFENVHIAPLWWEGLDARTQAALVRKMTDTANPFVEQKDDALRDDGILLRGFTVANRYTVGFSFS
ncbi:MAG: hypothetical protein Q7T86_03785 [Hyphomicrobiaceae bacterium]|nr:hypothetical protein [Hyphomicrobiaceae bacterium]